MTPWIRRAGLAAIGTAIVGVLGVAALKKREQQTEHLGYGVVARDGVAELRAYPACIVAETQAYGGRMTAMNEGFRRLAAYIFARDRPGPRIAMTVPVLADQVARRWRTRFVMPADRTLATLPAPARGVSVVALPARRMAAIAVAGRASDQALAAHAAQLQRWIADRGLRAGATSYAFYNSPMIPAPLRHSEVLIEIVD